MGIVPSSRIEKIQFYEAHLLPWTTNAASIGLTSQSVTGLSALVSAARTAFSAHLAAQEAARTATATFYEKVRLMHAGAGAGADMIQTIKTYAATKNDPNVYLLAQIPAPTPPGSVPPPGTPFDFSVGLLPDGSLDLRWKCSNPAGAGGTIYEVQRKLGSNPATPFAIIGGSGTKNFIDSTVPAGGGGGGGGGVDGGVVTYRITAVRSTTRGVTAQFTVNFGSGGASLTVADAVRIAA